MLVVCVPTVMIHGDGWGNCVRMSAVFVCVGVCVRW